MTAAALLERDAPLALLRQRIGQLRRTSTAGACVLVHGEAGVGKTSLLRHLQIESRGGADSVEWLWGACDPLLAPPPLAPLIDWLDRLPPALAASVRSGRQSGEVMAGLLELLRGSARPLVLVIDDAQWVDGATLDVMRYLARRIESTRALLVLAWRDDTARADDPMRALGAGLPTASTLRVPLQPLSIEAVAELARPAGRDARELYRITKGNPFFVRELLDSAGGRLPAAVRDAVLARAQPLPATAREVLDLVSVAVGEIELAAVDAVFDGAQEAIDRCVDSGLLVQHGGAVQFRHELARQAVESALGARARQSLNAALFDALSQTGASAARLVHHAELGGLAATVLRQAPLAAAEAALGGAARQAADLYALALRHADELPLADQATLQIAHAEQSLLANRLDDAVASRERALALHRRLGDPLTQGIALRELARLHWLQGRAAEGKPQAQAAIDLLAGVPGAERELAMAQATMAQLHVLDPTADAALAWSAQALPVLEALGDAEGLIYVLNTLASARLRTTDEPGAWAQLERSLTLALRRELQEHVLRAYVNMASAALVHRRLDILDRACGDGRAYCEAKDIDLFAARLTLRQAHGAIARGELADAARQVRGLRERAPLPPMEDEQSGFTLALVGLRQGEPAVREYWADAIEGRRRLRVDPWYSPQAVLHAEAAWLHGHEAACRRIVEDALPAMRASREGWRVGQLLCWAQRSGAASAAAPGEESLPAPMRLELAGDHQAAAAAWARLGCPYEQGLSLLGGDEAALRAALALFDAMGAGAAARIARQRLRARGAREIARGPIRGTRADPLNLTPRERSVLEMLGQGLSNRQIALRWHRSERTVENHVAALLAKLGVANRAEAAALARRASAPRGADAPGDPDR